MSLIEAVDPSLSGTGLAVADFRSPTVAPAFRVWTIGTPATAHIRRRHQVIAHHTFHHLDRPARHDLPRLVVIEERINYGRGDGRGTTVLDLAELRGVLMYGMYVRDIPVVEVHPARLKRFATVNGKASKADMIAAASADLGPIGRARNDNEADALWLLAMALQKYGAPIAPVTKDRTRVVNLIEWPPFILAGEST